MRNRLAVAVLSTVVAYSAFAQGTSSPPPMEMKNTGTPGQATAVRTMRATATVKAIDVANRTVTLQTKGGQPQTYSVGPEVKRLDEVAVGDTVVVDYTEGLMLEFQPAGTEAVTPQAVVVGERNAKDQAPGATASSGMRGTVTVMAIDMKTRHVVIQGPAGNLYQVKAGDNVHLEKLKVGDKLLATYVQSVAVNIAKQAKK